jgi:polysaccharide biosynthesis transport protein
MLLGSLMLAAILALSAVVLAEALDSTVRGARDVRSVFGSAPLAVVPEIRNSITRQRRQRRVGALAGSVLVGAPILYFIVRLATA